MTTSIHMHHFYRGYTERKRAEDKAAALRKQGYSATVAYDGATEKYEIYTHPKATRL